MVISRIVILIFITLCLIGCENDKQNPLKRISNYDTLTEYCFKGYVFLTYSDFYKGGLTQVWENTVDGPRPKMCTQEGAE